MNGLTGWPAVVVLIGLISVAVAFALLVHGYRHGRRLPTDAPRLRMRLLDRQPVPRLTEEVKREFVHRCYQSGGIHGALEWLSELWNVEVQR